MIPVKSKNRGNSKGFKYIAIIIIYLMSPPPKITFGIINNIITKKIKIIIETIKEVRTSWFSIKPKITKNKNSVITVIFGILNLVQSV